MYKCMHRHLTHIHKRGRARTHKAKPYRIYCLHLVILLIEKPFRTTRTTHTHRE